MSYTEDKLPTGLTAKTTPVDDDVVVIGDSEDATEVAKKVTGTNLKAYLKTYNDTLYQEILTEGAFVDGDKTKLDGIETGADVTDATNVDAAGAVMNSDTTTAGMSFVIDEDNMASDSATKVPTQQSVKAYADTMLPKAGGTMTGNITLGENTSVDLDPALSADGKYSGVCITGTAGATLAFGDLVYLAVADSRWELADADALATGGHLIGMCVLAAGADGDATKILLQGNIRADAAFPTLTVGAPVYMGETAGDVQTAIPTGADNIIRVVGFALTADSMYFNPSPEWQVTVA